MFDPEMTEKGHQQVNHSTEQYIGCSNGWNMENVAGGRARCFEGDISFMNTFSQYPENGLASNKECSDYTCFAGFYFDNH